MKNQIENTEESALALERQKQIYLQREKQKDVTREYVQNLNRRI